jgi:formylglycine-generating enzyme required for sulfatase activity
VWEKDLDDGNTVHAEVGSYRANRFGLHDVIGNVWEWCLDGYGGYGLPVRSGDGLRELSGASNRVDRGGGFNVAASLARASARDFNIPAAQYDVLGLRPAGASLLSASQLHPAGK